MVDSPCGQTSGGYVRLERELGCGVRQQGDLLVAGTLSGVTYGSMGDDRWRVRLR